MELDILELTLKYNRYTTFCLLDEPIPNNGRFSILDTGRTLRITHVTHADRDVYVCRAESAAGRMEAQAELEVASQSKCSDQSDVKV